MMEYYILHDGKGKGIVFKGYESLIYELLEWSFKPEIIPMQIDKNAICMEIEKVTIDPNSLPCTNDIRDLNKEGECELGYYGSSIRTLTMKREGYDAEFNLFTIDNCKQEFIASYQIREE